jgi:hypothetical protein
MPTKDGTPVFTVFFKWLLVDYPTTERLMIEQQINNDQNNHRHTQQPA